MKFISLSLASGRQLLVMLGHARGELFVGVAKSCSSSRIEKKLYLDNVGKVPHELNEVETID